MAQLTIQQAFQNALQHHQAGQLPQAQTLYRQVLAQQPDHADALYYLGLLAQQVGNNGSAVDLIRQAIALKPRWPEACCNLGVALKTNGQVDAAMAAYRQAIALQPNYPKAYNNLGNALKEAGQMNQAIAAYRQAVAQDPDNAAIHSNLLYALQFHPIYDAQTIAQEHHSWNCRHAQPLKKYIQPHAHNPNPDRRLRIGYVSPDFRTHVVGRFLLPLLAHHNKLSFEIFGYAQVSIPDAMTQHLRSYIDGWRNILGMSDQQAADLIRQDQIDILVDLSLHMAGNRLLVFARKPAPIQISWLGYPGTTGLKTIDYRITNANLDPPGLNDAFYSEESVRLPDVCCCYQPTQSTVPVNALPALTTGYITFGCLNNYCKISANTLTAWAKILLAVPRSHLLLFAQEGVHRQRTAERLECEGIAPERIIFVGFGGAKYFEFYHQIDMVLDPFPYGGGTTTCDALWMGVPVITLAANAAFSRMGLDALTNIGLPELITRTPEQYIQTAITLAADLPRLSGLRLTLRQRMQQSPLMDAPRFTRNLEAAYRQMWRTWCST